jgi:hypothetical protein
LRLNPADVAAVENEIPALQGVFNDLGRVNIVGDEKIERGGVLLTDRKNSVDLQLARQFAALERELTGGENDPFGNDWLPAVAKDAEVPIAESQVPSSSPAENKGEGQEPKSENAAPNSTFNVQREIAKAPPEPEKTIQPKPTLNDLNAECETRRQPPAPVKTPAVANLKSLGGLGNDPEVEAAIAATLQT